MRFCLKKNLETLYRVKIQKKISVFRYMEYHSKLNPKRNFEFLTTPFLLYSFFSAKLFQFRCSTTQIKLSFGKTKQSFLEVTVLKKCSLALAWYWSWCQNILENQPQYSHLYMCLVIYKRNSSISNSSSVFLVKSKFKTFSDQHEFLYFIALVKQEDLFLNCRIQFLHSCNYLEFFLIAF